MKDELYVDNISHSGKSKRTKEERGEKLAEVTTDVSNHLTVNSFESMEQLK